jgi:hypothetical protein
MEWTVWVIKVYGITTGSWITVLREGKETFPSRISQRFKISVSWDLCCCCCVVLHIFQMEGEVSRVKRARMLSKNQIRNIVMDSDSDEEAYYISIDTEDKQQPRPPSPISKTDNPDYYPSSSEDDGDVENVAGRQPQPSQWTLPPKPGKHVVHTFIGAPRGKAVKLRT